MNAKRKYTLFKPLAVCAAALSIALFTPAIARADHDALFKLACDLESVTDDLVCDYTNELKYSGRWYPCGNEKELLNALNTAEKCADQIHESVKRRCGFEELNRHVCETRTALNRAKSLVHCARVSRRIHLQLGQADRILCAIEADVAAQAAHAAHESRHRSHRHAAPAPPAQPRPPIATAPRGRVFRTDNREEVFRYFISRVFQDRRRW